MAIAQRAARARGLRAAPLRLERDEPDPRPVHARAGPHRAWPPRAPSGRTRSCARCCCRSSACTCARSRGRPDGRAATKCRTCAAPNGPAATPMLTGAALFSGFYLNELLMKLLARHDPHPALFDAYAADACRRSARRRRASRRRRCARSSCAAARDRRAARPEPRHADAAAGRGDGDATRCWPMPASARRAHGDAGARRRDC